MTCPRCMEASGLCVDCEAYLYGDRFEDTPHESYDLQTLSQKYRERLFTPEALRLLRDKESLEASAPVAEGSD